MKKQPTLSGLIVLLCTIAISSLQCSSAKKSLAADRGKEVIFFDDFSGASLDRSKWNVHISGSVANQELQAYVDSAITLSVVQGAAAQGAFNGALKLQPHFAPGFVTKEGKSFDFISSRIHTRDKVEFMYGTASARIKLTEGSGLWPAWWMLGNGKWPDCGEIDIMEYIGEKDWASAAVHGPGYSGLTPFVNRLYFGAAHDVTNWHIYAVDWTPDTMVFKYDGIPMFRVTKTMAERFGKWAFDNNKYLLLNFALGGAYPANINGVNKPYFGLPDATIEKIKAGQSYMLVDWVRVSR